MPTPQQLELAHNFILRHLMGKGYAPFYTEVAAQLGVSMEEGRQLVHELIKAGVPGFLFPETDHIVAMPPFSSLPTHNRISIEGKPGWYAQ
ncbi:hypothetical protein [Desulfoferula mesophila]|uniref:Uncharacterized protein n=1 Tax=Desulfoferula mesophila TaxID=3058419 RepID=A0AAU9E8G4_9BACT|nr:hypothetical protein FAK_05090 [Desulfoferula mesophilus]